MARNVEDFVPPMDSYDFIVVGAGTAGLPCAIFGARAGARVLVVEKEARIDLTGIYGSVSGLRPVRRLRLEPRELDWEGKLLKRG